MEKGARLIKNDHDAKSFYEIVEFCGLQNDLVGSEKKAKDLLVAYKNEKNEINCEILKS